MEHRKAIVVTIIICTLSLFSLGYAYWDSRPAIAGTVGGAAIEGIWGGGRGAAIGAGVGFGLGTLAGMKNKSPEERAREHNKRQDEAEATLGRLYDQHEQLITENKDLITQRNNVNDTAIKKIPFVSTIDTKSFKNTHDEINFVKKEMHALKKENSSIKREIKKLEKKNRNKTVSKRK
jgi:hypothetical protein